MRGARISDVFDSAISSSRYLTNLFATQPQATYHRRWQRNAVEDDIRRPEQDPAAGKTLAQQAADLADGRSKFQAPRRRKRHALRRSASAATARQVIQLKWRDWRGRSRGRAAHGSAHHPAEGCRAAGSALSLEASGAPPSTQGIRCRAENRGRRALGDAAIASLERKRSPAEIADGPQRRDRRTTPQQASGRTPVADQREDALSAPHQYERAGMDASSRGGLVRAESNCIVR